MTVSPLGAVGACGGATDRMTNTNSSIVILGYGSGVSAYVARKFGNVSRWAPKDVAADEADANVDLVTIAVLAIAAVILALIAAFRRLARGGGGVAALGARKKMEALSAQRARVQL